ncbi:MAG TPA: hypothetical protein VGN42_04750 [Pirellulales bacterium]|nr:hypothetical protein [Pirellulales bacterium]
MDILGARRAGGALAWAGPPRALAAVWAWPSEEVCSLKAWKIGE